MDNIKLIKNDKFKNIYISLRFASKKGSNVSARALLAMMLSDRSQSYNTKVLMNEKLDNMFGANLSSTVLNYGSAHILELSLSALSYKYVEENLLDQQIEFLSELLYKPLLDEASFKEAKLLLEDLIERESDSLGSYVVNESLRVAGQGFPLEISRYGDLESLELVTLEMVKDEYGSLIKNDSLQIMVVGDVVEDDLQTTFKKYFNTHLNHSFESAYLITNTGLKETIIKDIPSPYYSIVYNTHTKNVGREYWALQLMSMVLGQLPNSFLFQEVREKRSLCYSIRSIVSGYDGILVITAGVRSGHDDEAIDLSMAQVERLKNEGVSQSLFNSAKTMMINSINQTEDSSHRLVDSHYRRLILNEDLDTQGIVNIIEDIRVDEIISAANKLELNTIYKLKKGEFDEENSK